MTEKATSETDLSKNSKTASLSFSPLALLNQTVKHAAVNQVKATSNQIRAREVTRLRISNPTQLNNIEDSLPPSMPFQQAIHVRST
jgi:hypothetical protein